MGIGVGIPLLYNRQAEIHIIAYVLPELAAVFDLPVTPTTELLSPENVGLAFRVSLLSGIGAEILHYFICTSATGGHP